MKGDDVRSQYKRSFGGTRYCIICGETIDACRCK